MDVDNVATSQQIEALKEKIRAEESKLERWRVKCPFFFFFFFMAI